MNIVLILCDQFRADCLGILGHPVVETPVLDTLASEGVLFRRAYSPCPSCIPSRACLFTGMSPDQTGFLGYEDGHNWDFRHMLPEVLRNNGYQTCCVGKTHFYPQYKHGGYEILESYEAWQQLSPGYVNDYHEWVAEKSVGRHTELQHGLDDNGWYCAPCALPEELHNNSWVVERGLSILRRRDRTRPYFLTLSFHRPHPPIDPPQRYWDMYKDREWDPAPVGDWAAGHQKPVCGLHAWEGELPAAALGRMRLGYYAQVSHIDSQIGRFLRTLRSRRDMPDLIVFTSDHGEMLGDHHLLRKTYAYEGSAAIPCIIWQKGNTEGRVEKQPVVIQDLYTTILEYAGAPVPEGIAGKSLRGTVEGKRKEPVHKWIHGEHSACYSEDEAMQFLTDGKRKYIWFTKTGKEQFFDLETDPRECRDLAGKAARREELLMWRSRMAAKLSGRCADGLSDGVRLIPGLLPAVREGRR